MKKVFIFLILVNLVWGIDKKEKEKAFTIYSYGFDKYYVGQNIVDFIAAFGEPEEKSGISVMGSLYYYSKGFYVNYEKNIITHFGFIFYDETGKYKPFNGYTDKNIKSTSSLKDIISIYGNNYKKTNGFPNIADFLIVYKNLKMVFFFSNEKKLLRIVVYQKK